MLQKRKSPLAYMCMTFGRHGSAGSVGWAALRRRLLCDRQCCSTIMCSHVVCHQPKKVAAVRTGTLCLSRGVSLCLVCVYSAWCSYLPMDRDASPPSPKELRRAARTMPYIRTHHQHYPPHPSPLMACLPVDNVRACGGGVGGSIGSCERGIAQE